MTEKIIKPKKTIKIKTEEPETGSEEIVLNAYLARAGICSRRAAVDLIKHGQITVNYVVMYDPGFKVMPNDVIRYKDKIVKEETKIYLLLNKPKGCVTTVSDEKGRKTVMDLVQPAGKERLFPVGRLDRDTTGLLVITNDGYLSQKLGHPKNKVSKRYYAVLDQLFQVEDVAKLKSGVYLEDGKAWVDKINFVAGKKRNHVMVEIHGGKKRIIKRMFDHLGYKVIGLDRINYAGLVKRGLPIGRWRLLTEAEIEMLKSL